MNRVHVGILIAFQLLGCAVASTPKPTTAPSVALPVPTDWATVNYHLPAFASFVVASSAGYRLESDHLRLSPSAHRLQIQTKTYKRFVNTCTAGLQMVELGEVTLVCQMEIRIEPMKTYELAVSIDEERGVFDKKACGIKYGRPFSYSGADSFFLKASKKGDDLIIPSYIAELTLGQEIVGSCVGNDVELSGATAAATRKRANDGTP